MIASATGQFTVYVSDEPIDETAVASVKNTFPGAMIFADVLEPLYDTSIPTREASQALGRVKSELEALVEQGAQVVVLCQRRVANLGTRAHFMASLCASADRVHFLKST